MQKLAITAAAVAVCILPTACDYPLASPPGAPTAPVGGQPGDGVSTTAPVVVPVGNTTSATSSRTKTRTGTKTRTRTRTARPTTSTTTASNVPVTDPASETPTETATSSETVAPTESTIAAPTETTAASSSVVVPPPTVVTPENGPLNGNNGLDVLGRDCTASTLKPHSGFQDTGARCVSTAMGEVAPETSLPSLLITEAPTVPVGVGKPFMLKVATRNLVRDRFLGAAAGGYYLESSFLQNGTLQRGHFHTACRMLGSTSEAPDSSPAPLFFLATQDGGGGAGSDTVTLEIKPDPAKATPGTMQCSSWAGDGSHRTPMMSRANQTPAFDSVRIQISGNAAAPVDAADAAAAQQDAAQQQEAQQQEAAEQAPDQDGAPQPGGEASAPGAGGTAAPAPATSSGTAAPATPAANPTSAAPSSKKSLADRFKELRDRRAGQGGN